MTHDAMTLIKSVTLVPPLYIPRSTDTFQMPRKRSKLGGGLGHLPNVPAKLY